jgi:hypothetical protein
MCIMESMGAKFCALSKTCFSSHRFHYENFRIPKEKQAYEHTRKSSKTACVFTVVKVCCIMVMWELVVVGNFHWWT